MISSRFRWHGDQSVNQQIANQWETPFWMLQLKCSKLENRNLRIVFSRWNRTFKEKESYEYINLEHLRAIQAWYSQRLDRQMTSISVPSCVSTRAIEFDPRATASIAVVSTSLSLLSAEWAAKKNAVRSSREKLVESKNLCRYRCSNCFVQRKNWCSVAYRVQPMQRDRVARSVTRRCFAAMNFNEGEPKFEKVHEYFNTNLYPIMKLVFTIEYVCI